MSQMSKCEIGEILPQKGAYLLVTSVDKLDVIGRTLEATYRVPKDPIWKDYHMPGDPMMPGTDIVHSAAQAAAVLFGVIMDGKKVMLGSIDEVKIYRPVLPEDVLYMKIEIKQIHSRAGRASFLVTKRNGDKIIRVAKGIVGGMLYDEKKGGEEAA